MVEMSMSEVENSEGQALRERANAHAEFLKEHLTPENLQKWGDAGMLENDGSGLLALCLNSENYMTMSDVHRAQVDQLIESIKAEVEK